MQHSPLVNTPIVLAFTHPVHPPTNCNGKKTTIVQKMITCTQLVENVVKGEDVTGHAVGMPGQDGRQTGAVPGEPPCGYFCHSVA